MLKMFKQTNHGICGIVRFWLISCAARFSCSGCCGRHGHLREGPLPLFVLLVGCASAAGSSAGSFLAVLLRCRFFLLIRCYGHSEGGVVAVVSLLVLGRSWRRAFLFLFLLSL